MSNAEKQAFDERKQRADTGEYDVTGKTVGQVVADQLAYDADQKSQAAKAVALAAQVRQRHDDQVRRLRDALTVALVDKGYRGSDWQSGQYDSFLTIELALKNNSAKTIRAIKGTLSFGSTMGDAIYSSHFEDD